VKFTIKTIKTKLNKNTSIVEETLEIDDKAVEIAEKLINNCIGKFEQIDCAKIAKELKKIFS